MTGMYAETIGSRLRLFIDQGDDREGRPLWGAIVELVRTEGLAGVTVSGGMEGIGADHLASIPVVIEVVDEPERIDALLPKLAAYVPSGIATIDEVRVIRYADRAAAR